MAAEYACPTCGRMLRTIHTVWHPVRERHLEAFTVARLHTAHPSDRDDPAMIMARALVDLDLTFRAALGKR